MRREKSTSDASPKREEGGQEQVAWSPRRGGQTDHKGKPRVRKQEAQMQDLRTPGAPSVSLGRHFFITRNSGKMQL